MGARQDLRMYEMKFILEGEGMKLLRRRRANLFARLLNCAAASSKPESVMDVHVHVVSK